MLQNLHVKNLALIDESEVDFAGGLNILSGETGAGKSIIIGSINLALGGKVQKEMLRDPEKPALVELIFSVTEKQKQVLKQLDVETEDDEVILSRRITGGRGVSKVNGESVPASKVKEIASVLIDIHGQHEHQSLLSKKKHLEILDSYAKEEIEQPKKELAEAYKDYKKLVSELNDADVDEEERLREVSFLEYEVGEIEEAGLTVGEDEELETQYKRFINGKKIVEALNQAYQYTGGMDQASELTGRALRELSGVSVYDEKIAKIVHRAGLPLIVDEAHGAHFRYSEIFPQSALELGADVVIQSVHKTLPSLTQTAVLHMKCNGPDGSAYMDMEAVERYLHIVQSSSPSYVLMASIENGIFQMEQLRRKDGMRKFADSLLEMRESLSAMKNLRLVGRELKGRYGIFDLDPSKVVISTRYASFDGEGLSELLRKQYHLEMEMCGADYVTAITAVGDSKAGLERLRAALLAIDKEGFPSGKMELQGREGAGSDCVYAIEAKTRCSIREAIDGKTARIPLRESAGKISGEFVYIYPPGIPLIAPGECITEQLLEVILDYIRKGLPVQGLSDQTLETILVSEQAI